ncbi:HAMP domain-containing sensor histidine kinase [Lentzea sp. BCCO 10_0856]|uniref:histidine kinase n=1 Tax=Lentzea miocenica TaxID=3095431 RepID=A0ABU4T3A4_9PSEU|nr:HAMP domain-containing sensor histidine kinase [Lentzea sp. BCCO 10_0856]MDX8032645.1 HAMP domain-containing sensor histidine kinase [Lentzea sp. BCCO 10_0856]
MAVSRRAGVRVRLTALAVLVVGLGLVVGGAVALTLVGDQLTGNAEAEARRQVDSFASVIADGLPSALPPLVQVVARDGSVLGASSELAHTRLLALWPESGVVTGTSRLPDGEHHAVAGVPASVRDRSVAVYAAVSLEHAEEGVEAATTALAIIVPLLLVAAGGTAWLVVGRALRPVEAIRERVTEITASQLDRRVPEPSADDEVGRLARTMNEMLARLEEVHERQRRFAADAAHELRSPLASLRTRLEVGLAHPSSTDWVRVAGDLHREAVRLGDLTDELIVLALADGVTEPVEWVDLDEVVLNEIDAVRARGVVDVELSPFSAARLRGRAGELSRVVRNLLDNAEHHARHRITVGLWSTERFAELVVADDGPGIPDSDRTKVFERFFRSQRARDRDTGGVGLGLAIVREVTERHGGAVWLADSTDGARFHVRLPLAVEPPA